jgi:hypothetical protein
MALNVTPGSAADDRHARGVLGGHHLDVSRQSGASDPEPAADPYIAKILTIPRTFLIPFILFFTLMGSYLGQNNSTELLILVGFGVIATILRFADFPLAPLLIGFILGTMLEDNFARAMQLYRGLASSWNVR